MNIDVQKAVAAARASLRDFFSEEPVQGILLEEVERSEDDGDWLITLSFIRNPKTTKGAIDTFLGEGPRTYKTLKVSTETGEVLSMKIRQLS